MTAQIEFFCSPQEELLVLDHLNKDTQTGVFFMDGQRTTELPDFSCDDQVSWQEFPCLYIWAKDLGPLRWHTKQPEVQGATHRSLVARLFAREDWDRLELAEGDKLLDQELSPGICFKRPERVDASIGPCTIIAPPSNLERVGTDYARWVKRCIAWIRRQGKKVHDWKARSTTIPNPRGLLNTVYAFPNALKKIESGDHPFAIL